MCKSIAEGGQRCATHLRPGYLRALEPALNQSSLTYEQQILLGASAIPYATTLKGIDIINADILRFLTHSKPEIAEILRISLIEGAKQREVIKEKEAIIKAKTDGYEFGTFLMTSGEEQGAPLAEVYKIVTEAASEIYSEFKNSPVDTDRERATLDALAEHTYKSVLSGALDFFNQKATPEQISELLEGRTAVISEDIKISSKDFLKTAEEIKKVKEDFNKVVEDAAKKNKKRAY